MSDLFLAFRTAGAAKPPEKLLLCKTFFHIVTNLIASLFRKKCNLQRSSTWSLSQVLARFISSYGLSCHLRSRLKQAREEEAKCISMPTSEIRTLDTEMACRAMSAPQERETEKFTFALLLAPRDSSTSSGVTPTRFLPTCLKINAARTIMPCHLGAGCQIMSRLATCEYCAPLSPRPALLIQTSDRISL